MSRMESARDLVAPLLFCKLFIHAGQGMGIAGSNVETSSDDMAPDWLSSKSGCNGSSHSSSADESDSELEYICVQFKGSLINQIIQIESPAFRKRIQWILKSFLSSDSQPFSLTNNKNFHHYWKILHCWAQPKIQQQIQPFSKGNL